ETESDVAAILEYIASRPEDLIAAAVRTGGGRGKKAIEKTAPLTGPFKEMDAFDFDSPTASFVGSLRTGDDVIDALVRMLATSVPQEEEDEASAEADEQELEEAEPRAQNSSAKQAQVNDRAKRKSQASQKRLVN